MTCGQVSATPALHGLQSLMAIELSSKTKERDGAEVRAQCKSSDHLLSTKRRGSAKERGGDGGKMAQWVSASCANLRIWAPILNHSHHHPRKKPRVVGHGCIPLGRHRRSVCSLELTGQLA